MRGSLSSEQPVAHIEGISGGQSQVISISDRECLLIGGISEHSAKNTVVAITS